MSRPAAPLALIYEVHILLAHPSRQGSPRLAERTRIVLACAEPMASSTFDTHSSG
jgi:hypothetical protein